MAQDERRMPKGAREEEDEEICPESVNRISSSSSSSLSSSSQVDPSVIYTPCGCCCCCCFCCPSTANTVHIRVEMCHRRGGGGGRKTPGHAMQLKRLRIIAIARGLSSRKPMQTMAVGGYAANPRRPAAAEGPVLMIWCVQREASHQIVVCFSWQHQQQQQQQRRPHYKS